MPRFLFADDIKLVGNPANDDLQAVLGKLAIWSRTWDLPFNEDKCTMLRKVRLEPRRLEEKELKEVDQVRDLGIQVPWDFSASAQCVAAANKARNKLYLVLRAVSSRDPRVLVPLYTVFVRPHLEYCVQAWSPSLKKD